MRQKEIIDTALEEVAPDLYLKGGRVVNVFTGEIYRADVAVKNGLIAYVGNDIDDKLLHNCRIIDVSGANLLPGYIEPHGHPNQLYNTVEYTRLLVQHGITTVVADSFKPLEALGAQEFARYITEIAKRTPVKVYWLLRIFSESYPSLKEPLLSLEELKDLLAMPRVLGIGETTRWTAILQKDPFSLKAIAMASSAAKRPDGHTAGAAGKKLAALAAAGISGCHESITAEEVRERLRNGMHVMLRHSSQRPDIEKFLSIIRDPMVDKSRLMLTSDGTSPAFMERNLHISGIAALIIKKGIDPLTALRMITLNPATYFRLDHKIGAIAPGRAADIVVSEGFNLNRPQMVIIDGKVVVHRGAITEEAKALFSSSPLINIKKTYFSGGWKITPQMFAVPAFAKKDKEDKKITFPVIEMANTVITKKLDLQLPVVNGAVVPENPSPGLLKISLLDMQKRRVSNGFIKGVADNLEGLASSLSCTLGTILVLGNSDEAMAKAANRVLQLGGGITVVESGRLLWEMRLELAGELTELPFEEVARLSAELEAIVSERGYPWDDFYHTLLFLPIDFLPSIRISREGIFDVLRREIIYPAID